MEVKPSPKFQKELPRPMLVLLNVVNSGEQPVNVATEKPGTGFGRTLIDFLILSAQPKPVPAIKVMV